MGSVDRVSFEVNVPVGEDGTGSVGAGGHGPLSVEVVGCSDKNASVVVEPEGADSRLVVTGAKPGTVTVTFSVPGWDRS